MKSLENEQRKAKKQAKTELARDEELAREYLTADARETFCKQKRLELIKDERYDAVTIEEMTDDELIEIDAEVKAEYEALPVASSFTRAEVGGMVEKIQESAAFDTDSLSVLSLNEIVAR